MTHQMGKLYRDGEYIVRQGEMGDCLYVMQSGKVEVVRQEGGHELCLATLGEGDIFGEMAVVERVERSASVRAVGEVWVLTVERRGFLRRLHEDPALAFRIVERLSYRIRDLDSKLVRAAAGTAAVGHTA